MSAVGVTPVSDTLTTRSICFSCLISMAFDIDVFDVDVVRRKFDVFDVIRCKFGVIFVKGRTGIWLLHTRSNPTVSFLCVFRILGDLLL